LYSGGTDWILYAYKIEDRILPERIAIYGSVPENIYGLGRPRAIYAFNIPFNEAETRDKLIQIGSAIRAGMVGGNEPVWKSFLLMVSARDEPIQLRIAALDLLGRIGSQETIPHLINIFQNDNEPLIRVAAANAIGNIGVDPQGIAIQSFLHSITRETGDEQILTAIASATGALCRFSGPPLSVTGVRILTMLTAGEQPPAVRRQANIELASLR
jgi:outer membrane protein assembly factor BamB